MFEFICQMDGQSWRLGKVIETLAFCFLLKSLVGILATIANYDSEMFANNNLLLHVLTEE